MLHDIAGHATVISAYSKTHACHNLPASPGGPGSMAIAPPPRTARTARKQACIHDPMAAGSRLPIRALSRRHHDSPMGATPAASGATPSTLGESPAHHVGGSPLHKSPRIVHAARTMNSTTATPWMSLAIPADRLQPLEVQLHDHSVRRAVWTGSRWWSEDREVAPIAWRPLCSPELAIAS